MWKSSPSAMSDTPIIIKNAKASTFTAGCLLINRLIGPEAIIITPTEKTTAAIITSMRSTMPTAVMTESKEKTMSMATICKIVGPKRAAGFLTLAFPDSVTFPWISLTACRAKISRQ